MTWELPPQLVQIPPSVGLYYNAMTASTAVDPTVAGYDGPYDVEYYFYCEEDSAEYPSGKSSGWQSEAYYQVQVADQFDYYHFKVMARDTSPNNNTTSWSCLCYANDIPGCGCVVGP
jgi:hypothetical protein